MSGKYQNKAKRGASGAKVYEAPVEWVELLRQAVEEPGTISKAYSLFHSYSVGNMMLAFYQLQSRKLPLGPIASYSRWQSLGRQVRKGETAIIMQVPRTFRKTIKDKDGEEKEEQGKYFTFRPTCFTYYQTDAIEGVEDGTHKLTDEMPDWSMRRALKALDVRERTYDDLDGNKQGYSLPKIRSIHINPAGQHQDRTRLHELTHVLLHQDGYNGTDHRGVIEAEAEAVSFIVSTVLGFSGAEESRGYIQHWMQKAGVDELTDKTAGRIFATAQKILAAGRPAKEQDDQQEEQAAA